MKKIFQVGLQYKNDKQVIHQFVEAGNKFYAYLKIKLHKQCKIIFIEPIRRVLND